MVYRTRKKRKMRKMRNVDIITIPDDQEVVNRRLGV
jgi:hypothetical protein